MRAATSRHPIEIRLRRDLPADLLEELRARYAKWIISSDSDDEVVDISETSGWKAFQGGQTPGSWIAGLRKTQGWTQRELGERLGGVPASRISDWENGRRSPSKAYAKELAGLFGVSAEYFM